MRPQDCLYIGGLAGMAVFFLCLSIRNWAHREAMRNAGSDEYLLGWKDALAKVRERIGWIESDIPTRAK